MTRVQDQRANVDDRRLRQRRQGRHDHACRTARRSSSRSYQEQGWTNSGTSGSPASATLLAASATTYTDPNGNSFQIQPRLVWAWASSNQSIDPYGDVDDQRPERQWPAERHRRRPEPDHPVRIQRLGECRPTITYPDLTSRPVHLQLGLRAADPHGRRTAIRRRTPTTRMAT